MEGETPLGINETPLEDLGERFNKNNFNLEDVLPPFARFILTRILSYSVYQYNTV